MFRSSASAGALGPSIISVNTTPSFLLLLLLLLLLLVSASSESATGLGAVPTDRRCRGVKKSRAVAEAMLMQSVGKLGMVRALSCP
jgi:hypothetical protein